MHMVHGLGQKMSMEPCLAPHLFEESKNFLRRNLPKHMNNQKPRETEGRRRPRGAAAWVQPTRAHTLHPRPSTLYPLPSTVYPLPSSLSPLPSTL